jgi:hypothetical protein
MGLKLSLSRSGNDIENREGVREQGAEENVSP